MKKIFSGIWFLSIIALSGCEVNSHSSPSEKLFETDLFKNYWYAGKAEISSYKLIQSRYGEERNGNAVLIFVTEDFSKKRLVKLDEPEKAGNDKISVLKMNFTKNFITGIYPYSMMLSTFTPVNRNQYPSSLKNVMSSQEWCGQVFTQMNLSGDNYEIQSHSYFESEGDENFRLNTTLLEDEILNIIRLDPNNLPTGKVEITPGLFFTRLQHTKLKPESAIINKKEDPAFYVYSIDFVDLQRTLIIRYEKDFPHKVVSWEETWNDRGKIMRTSAVLKKTLYLDYWTKNKNEFQILRDSLGLPSDY